MNTIKSSPTDLGSNKILLILAIAFSVVGIVSYQYFYLSPERVNKRDLEITRIFDKTYDDKLCEQYALVAVRNGWYSCFKCGDKDSIYLYKDEVWKYGKTCNEQVGRYSSGLPIKGLDYLIQFSGNEQECLIEEKRKIYNYPNLPECKKRNFILLRPAGNKIDR